MQHLIFPLLLRWIEQIWSFCQITSRHCIPSWVMYECPFSHSGYYFSSFFCQCDCRRFSLHLLDLCFDNCSWVWPSSLWQGAQGKEQVLGATSASSLLEFSGHGLPSVTLALGTQCNLSVRTVAPRTVWRERPAWGCMWWWTSPLPCSCILSVLGLVVRASRQLQ